MKKVLLFTAIATLALAVGVLAQGKPNFAGKWVLDPAQSQMGGGPGGGAPGGAPPGGGAPGGGGGRGGFGAGPQTITQTAAELVVERTMGETVQKTVYKLDGSPSVNETRGGQSTSVAKWDGAKLVVTTKAETQRGPTETTETWSLASDGSLVIERTRQGQSGPVTTKMVYKKQ